MDAKSADVQPFPTFTEKDYKSVSYISGAERLNKQLAMIFASNTAKDKPQLYIEQFSESLGKLSSNLEKTLFDKMFVYLALSLRGVDLAISNSNIDIIKILCKWNDYCGQKFDYTDTLRFALQQSQDVFNENIINLFVAKGAKLDDFYDSNDGYNSEYSGMYGFLPSPPVYKECALYHCVDNDNYKFNTLKMLINLDNKYGKVDSGFNYKKHFGDTKFKVIVANAIRNNSFQSLKYLLSLDQQYKGNLIKQACCYNGTIDSQCEDSKLIKQTPYICSLVSHEYRDMWQFLKERVFSKVDKNDIERLANQFNMYDSAIKLSKTIESELFWVKELIQLGVTSDVGNIITMKIIKKKNTLKLTKM